MVREYTNKLNDLIDDDDLTDDDDLKTYFAVLPEHLNDI